MARVLQAGPARLITNPWQRPSGPLKVDWARAPRGLELFAVFDDAGPVDVVRGRQFTRVASAAFPATQNGIGFDPFANANSAFYTSLGSLFTGSGNQPCSFETLVYFRGLTGSAYTGVHDTDNEGGTFDKVLGTSNSTNNTPAFYIFDGSSNSVEWQAGSAPGPGLLHIVGVSDGSTTTVYMNGVGYSQAGGYSYSGFSAPVFAIGCQRSIATLGLNDTSLDVILHAGLATVAWTAEEVRQRYINMYDFLVPAAGEMPAINVAATTTTGGARYKQRWNRSPLAYPAGAKPGFDPGHVAAKGVTSKRGLSIVASGNNFINLLSGTLGTVGGSPTTKMLAGVGAGVNFTSAGSRVEFTGNSTDALTNVGTTTAAIVQFDTLAGSGLQCIIQSDNGSTFQQLDLDANLVSIYTNGSHDTTFTPTVGVPYFIACSVSPVVGGNSTYNFVIVNLSTGRKFSQTSLDVVSGSALISVGDYSIGGNGGSQQMLGTIAAAMFSYRYASMQELLQWASDPWSFWYPRQTIQYTTPAAVTTTTGGVRVRQRFNRSPLAYPAGAKPGFDSSHVAAENPRLSALASSGGMVDLLTGKPGTRVGSPPNALEAVIGPAINSPTASDGYNFAGRPAVLENVVTIAAIIHFTAFSGGAAQVVFDGSSDGESWGFYSAGNNGNALTLLLGSGGRGTEVPLNFPADPCFVAISGNKAGSDASFSAVIKNLRNGVIISGSGVTTGGGTTLSASNGTYSVGNNVYGAPAMCNIAAVMFSGTRLSESQLRAWATDPWTYWYPNKTINLTSTAATSVGATFLPVWAVGYNLPVIGTGIY